MKALSFRNRILAVTEESIPKTDSESVVKIILSGICNTDLEITQGYSGHEGILGHEFVGVVESSPDERLIGRRVVGEINAGCGVCRSCLLGDARHCESRTVMGIVSRQGCHAEYVALPTRNLVLVPDSVSDREAVFAEPLAAALGIAERTNISVNDKVAVVGDGKLGILCALAMSRISRDTVLIGKHEVKMKRAEKLGIRTTYLETVSDSKNDFDVVIEASGSRSGFETAMRLVRPRGRIVLKSTFHGESSWEAWRLVVDEISLIGSRCGRLSEAIGFMESNESRVETLIDEVFDHLSKYMDR